MTVTRVDPWQWRSLLQQEITLPREVPEVPVHEAAGAVLGADVHSPESFPAVAIAAMDGFAVRRADLASGTTTLPVSSEIPAGPGEIAALAPGTAARIMTGAPIPTGADAVIEVEATDADPYGPAPATVALRLQEVPAPRRHVRDVGEEVARGDVLARSGDRVGGGLIGLVRALGLGTLPILRPLRVAVVVTGDELAGDDAAPGTVRESNGTMLGAALAGDGVEASALHSGDDHSQLRSTLETAAERSDLVLTTGGIGHGAFDVVKTLLGERGSATSRFEHLALRPGGPQGAGRLPDGTPVIHLPGTPVGALVGYHLFVRPLLPGAEAAPRRIRLGDADPGAGHAHRGGLHVVPGRLGRDADGSERVELLPGCRLAPYGRADAMVLREADESEEGPDGTVLVLGL
ncbi:molybdopterin molybdotransferase MoeA [Brachybacterium sacelli]|uniref:Molybdopterin molybdenumtransferase n=1 Tax=Brachybacterium sacelli TaxID=173364 RepID=A0ABS4X0G7_9MICO|nr:molybdopterin molybdotransferase MoeA [Brachybacterium sacelli]MBP2381957.1 molybdopterin molybdotransferase [Brachybacterium sacelli]